MPSVGTFLANLVGRRLIPLNFLQQRFEANFRFSLVRVRENAEGIALYHGEQREQPNLNERFADVFTNGWRVLFTRRSLPSTRRATPSSPSSSPMSSPARASSPAPSRSAS